MTEIGNRLLAEYVSEVNEKIEDDRNKLIANQALNFVVGICRIVYLNFSLFLSGFSILLLASIFFIDSAAINTLRAASNDEILDYISSIKYLAYVVSFLVLIFIVGNSINRYFRNVKQERLEAEQKHTDLLTLIVTIQDELLIRHKLVNQEYNQNA
jgi:ABC-type multidrug transport system fused ATPase/permease subunit